MAPLDRLGPPARKVPVAHLGRRARVAKVDLQAGRDLLARPDQSDRQGRREHQGHPARVGHPVLRARLGLRGRRAIPARQDPGARQGHRARPEHRGLRAIRDPRATPGPQGAPGLQGDPGTCRVTAGPAGQPLARRATPVHRVTPVPQGNPGPQGPAGPSDSQVLAAVSGTSGAGLSAGQSYALTSTCPAGKKILGGGWTYSLSTPNQSSRVTLDSYPSAANAWTVTIRVNQNLGGTVTISLSVYAVCTV